MPGLRKGNGSNKLMTASGMDMPQRGGSWMQAGPSDSLGSSSGSAATPKTAKKQSSGNGGKPTMNKNMAGKGKEQADVESKQKKGYSSKAKQGSGSHSPGAKGQTKTARKEKNFNTDTYF